MLSDCKYTHQKIPYWNFPSYVWLLRKGKDRRRNWVLWILHFTTFWFLENKETIEPKSYSRIKLFLVDFFMDKTTKFINLFVFSYLFPANNWTKLEPKQIKKDPNSSDHIKLRHKNKEKRNQKKIKTLSRSN